MAVLSISAGCILIWWLADKRSIFENSVLLANLAQMILYWVQDNCRCWCLWCDNHRNSDIHLHFF